MWWQYGGCLTNWVVRTCLQKCLSPHRLRIFGVWLFNIFCGGCIFGGASIHHSVSTFMYVWRVGVGYIIKSAIELFAVGRGCLGVCRMSRRHIGALTEWRGSTVSGTPYTARWCHGLWRHLHIRAASRPSALSQRVGQASVPATNWSSATRWFSRRLVPSNSWWRRCER